MATENKEMSLGRMIVTCTISALLVPALILPLSGDWLWLEGWIFCLWFDAMYLSMTIYMYRHYPALLVERSKMAGAASQETWDKVFFGAYWLLSLACMVIMPLDAKRYGWTTHFPGWLKFVGGVALLAALFFVFRSTVENAFLSSVIRIQKDRKQHVISTGVYGFVRHPLYLGCVFMSFGGPLLLGSIWALVLGLVADVFLAGRIIGEEEMLVNELEGYEDYKKKVKYRLIPLMW